MAAWQFGSFRFDPLSGELRSADSIRQLPPIPARFLDFLIRNADRVVSRDEISSSVWEETSVGKGSIGFVVSQLRRFLGEEDPRNSSIEAISGRGYRFARPVRQIREGPQTRLPAYNGTLIGRARELALLGEGFDQARRNSRQIFLLRGESGAGKTTLLRAFLEQLDDGVSIGLGQCLERYGAGEAFLPWIEILRDLLDGDRSGEVEAILREIAPIWSVRLQPTSMEGSPGSIDDVGTTSSRFQILSLIVALETIARRRPLVLAIEDLQWCDPSTMEVVLALAGRSSQVPIMVVATYRTDGGEAEDDPTRLLLSRLLPRGLSRDITLSPLGLAEVECIVAREYPENDFPSDFAETLHRRSEGNPLFVLSLLRGLQDESILVHDGRRWHLEGTIDGLQAKLSRNLVLLVRKQASRLEEVEYECVEAASVVGQSVSAELVSALTGRDVQAVDETCGRLVRRGLFLRSNGVTHWPDGTLSSAYAFVHGAHQEVVYDGIPPARRRRLHGLAAERLEAGYAGDRRQVYGPLTVHFKRGGNVRRAATYHRRSGSMALEKLAATEAIHHFQSALRLLDSVPSDPEVDAEKVLIWLSMATAYVSCQGHAAPTVSNAFVQVRKLCQRLQPSLANLYATTGLAVCRLVAGDFDAVVALTEENVAQVAQRGLPPALATYVRLYESQARLYMGQIALAAEVAEPLVRITDQADFLIQAQRSFGLFWVNPRVSTRIILAGTRTMQGRPDDSLEIVEECLAIARESRRPYDHAHSINGAILTCYLPLRNWKRTAELSAITVELADRHGFSWVRTVAVSLSEIAKQENADLAKAENALQAFLDAGGIPPATILWGTMAEIACLKGEYAQARSYIDLAFAQARKFRERMFEPELHRLLAILEGHVGDEQQAATHLEEANSLAQDLGETWWLLRIANTYFRLFGRRNPSKARQRIESALALVRGGDQFLDIYEAHQLLNRG